MPLTQAHEFSSVTVGEFGHISVRIDQVIYDGTAEVSRRPHRHVIAPGDDTSKELPRVQEIAKVAWTPEILKQYAALKLATSKEG